MLQSISYGTSPAFFLGANTPEGFVSLFSGLYFPEEGWRLYILIGGPGTGKSSVMKKIAAEADARGIFCERIHCSSDPASLDAVIMPGLKVSIADGTSPHVIEPRFPGVCEKVVDLGAYRHDEALRENGEKIIAKTLENSLEHKKCIGFLRAAALAAADNRLLLAPETDGRKLRNFSLHLAEKLIGSVSSGEGRVSRRFLSALTPAGETMFDDTVSCLCEHRIVLEDAYGVCAPVILKVLEGRAVRAGLSVIECPCAMRSGKVTEHLILPELSLGIFTANKYHPFEGEREKTVHCQRFIAPSAFREHRNRISFNVKAQKEFTDEAVERLKNAKALHDELESYYINAMDFTGVKRKTKELTAEIFA